jgi:hypothetical protein
VVLITTDLDERGIELTISHRETPLAIIESEPEGQC